MVDELMVDPLEEELDIIEDGAVQDDDPEDTSDPVYDPEEFEEVGGEG
jgi:hypothetical protein